MEKIILLLSIGHLMGDFIFQTKNIVVWKSKEFAGTAFHAAIVSLVMLTVSLPFYPNIYWLVLLQGMLHSLIDWWKIRSSFGIPNRPTLAFLIDQILHFLVILGGVYLFFSHGWLINSSLEINLWILQGLVAYLFSTVFASIFLQMITNSLYPPTVIWPFLSVGDRFIGILERILLTTAIIKNSLILGILGLVFTPLVFKLDFLGEKNSKRVWLRFFLSILWAVFIGLCLKYLWMQR